MKRPGLHYNKATLKQRMLEAILATPDARVKTGDGLNLLERLSYMKRGFSVQTTADLGYIADNL